MNKQLLETIGVRFKSAATMATAFAIALSAAGLARAGNGSENTSPTAPSSTQNVNVVNTPTVNVGNTPTVNIGNTPTVNANISFPGNQNVTVTGAGPLTNVGRLPSQQLTLVFATSIPCASKLYMVGSDASTSCFDMASHPGQILVITDITWLSAGTAGNTCTFQFSAGSNPFPLWWSFAVAAADGVASLNEHLTTGIKTTLNPSFSSIAGVNAACSQPEVFLRGYFLANQ